MPSTLVYLADRGVGDLIWHLPTIRAIAQETSEKRVDLVTRPTTKAVELLKIEPSVDRIRYVKHRTGAARQVQEVLDFYQVCRELRPKSLWVLEKIGRPAFAAMLAGVKERRGFGLGHGQERWNTAGTHLPSTLRRLHRLDKLPLWQSANGLRDVPTEPALQLPSLDVQSAADRYSENPRPWVLFGVGAVDAHRRWPLERYLALADELKVGTYFWAAPEMKDQMARMVQSASRSRNVVLDLKMDEFAAFAANVDLMIGSDSGPMNLAVAVSRPTIGLFGASPRLSFSKFLHPVGDERSGMSSITVSMVAEEARRLCSALNA